MSKQPIYEWDETSGIASCSIWIDDILYGFGMAECADADRDMISERTGSRIAELRAQIDILQHYKNYELRPGLKALLHLKGTMTLSSKYNPESYEAKRLNKEINNFKKDIIDTNKAIQLTKQQLYNYIKKKEILYQRIRAKDHEGYKDEDSETLQKDIALYERVIKDGATP